MIMVEDERSCGKQGVCENCGEVAQGREVEAVGLGGEKWRPRGRGRATYESPVT